MIRVPASVLAYHTQPDVEMAVDLLLSTGGKPPALRTWPDVPSYFRAWLAAQQTKGEFASFIEEFWNAAWGDIPATWRARAPNDPARSDLSVAIDTIWAESCYSRRFERGAYALELSAGLWADEFLQLGVVLYGSRDKVLLNDSELDGWTQAEEFDTLWTDKEIVQVDETVDPTAFGPLVATAWAAVDAAIGAL